jgi:RNA polymerase sigma factor (TIGR02999 family)
MRSATDTTQLLLAARAGDREAFDNLYSRLYDELRAIAHKRLSRNRHGETLNTAALVHEAYLKLVDQTRVDLSDRAHFLALASRAMRFIIVDHARARAAKKRSGAADAVPLDTIRVAADDRAADLLELDDALERLARFDDRLGRIVEYRFFGGLTYDEIAAVTGVSVPTAKRDWVRARTWLYRALRT